METPRLPQMIVLSKDGDLTLRLHTVVDKDTKFQSIIATLLVSRRVLITHSKPFRNELAMNKTQRIMDIEENSPVSVAIVLYALHGESFHHFSIVSIEIVWDVIEYCRKREIDTKTLKAWFAKLMATKPLDKLNANDMRRLLLPTYVFDHAKAFAVLSKRLAYELTVSITELNASPHSHLELDSVILFALNGARGSLRSDLIKCLMGPLEEFTRIQCSCRRKALLSYVTSLTKTHLWPMESHHKHSVKDILMSPGLVDFNPRIPEGTCYRCKLILSSTRVAATRLKILDKFQGLCLDCIERTRDGVSHAVYWESDLGHREHSRRCRIDHGQSTWYFSFVGKDRRHEMLLHTNKKMLDIDTGDFVYM